MTVIAASSSHRVPSPGLVVASRYVAMGVAVLAVAALHVRRPATLCLLRATTGVPCPFCGGTTAAVHLGHGDVRGAVAASPLALLMLAAWPLLGVVRAPRWWHMRAARWSVIAVVLVSAEVWQLLRFGLIGA
ncbi:MAG TPA: DUF2752 domain-containing protein [Mycobacteriales bacterium]|nr:DUF2752 domain-containing protein [Mycobacteriales bacterium]